MAPNRFRLPTLLTATALVLLGAACVKPTPAFVETNATPAQPATATATAARVTKPPAGCVDEQVIWPQLSDVQPAQIQPGGEVTVMASGGYLRCGDSYNESARDFALTLDGQPAGSLSCYVNHCEAKLVVPAEAAPGAYVIAAEGGSEINLHVVED